MRTTLGRYFRVVLGDKPSACFLVIELAASSVSKVDAVVRLRYVAARADRFLIRDSVDWIVWAVPAGSEGAPVEGRAARQGSRLFLDEPATVCTVYQN
jgi:hypothetical protein